MGKAVTSEKIVLREVICATDFSAHSVSVLAHGAAIARRYRSRLYLVHVIPTDVYRSVPAEVMTEALKQTRAYAQDAMRNQLHWNVSRMCQMKPLYERVRSFLNCLSLPTNGRLRYW